MTPLPDSAASMPSPPEVKRVRKISAHLLFQVGAIFKGLDGAIELAIGSILVLWPARIDRWMEALTQGEGNRAGGDPLLVTTLRSLAQFSASNKLFATLYLLIHGVVKIALVVGLLRGVLWVYPVALTVLSLMLAYQLYRYFLMPSAWLLVLSITDVVVIVLIGAELRRLRRLAAERAGEM